MTEPACQVHGGARRGDCSIRVEVDADQEPELLDPQRHLQRRVGSCGEREPVVQRRPGSIWMTETPLEPGSTSHAVARWLSEGGSGLHGWGIGSASDAVVPLGSEASTAFTRSGTGPGKLLRVTTNSVHPASNPRAISQVPARLAPPEEIGG